jgi:mannosyltransferase
MTTAVPPAAAVPAARRHPRGSERAHGSRHEDLLVVVVPAALALVLCLVELTARSLWLDEAATVAIASQHGRAFGAALARDGGNMLGYYALLHVLVSPFGSGAFVIRLPSVIAACVTAGLTAQLGLRLFGRRVGLVAGVLTAVSLTLVYWGQVARGYAPMIALVAASFLVFLTLLERRGWVAWIGYVVVTTAAVYAGLEAVLIVPAQLIAIAWHRDRLRPVLTAVATVAVCCAPLAVLAANRGSGQLFWVPPPSFRILKQVVQSLTSAGLQPSYYTGTTTTLVVLTLIILAGGVVALERVRRTGNRDATRGPVIVLSWLLLPALLAALESAFGQSIFQPRYLLVSLPAVSLFLAWTIVAPGLPRLLALAALAALLTLRALQLAPAYGVSSENWRGATRLVAEHTRARDCVAFYPSDNRQAFKYYLGRSQPLPEPILPELPWAAVRSFVEDYATLSPGTFDRLPSLCGRVWLVTSHEGRAGGPPISRRNYLRFAALTNGLSRNYPRARSWSFSPRNVVAVTLYSR